MGIFNKIRMVSFDDLKKHMKIILIIIAVFIFLRFLNSKEKIKQEIMFKEIETARNAKPVIDMANQTILSDEVVPEEVIEESKNGIELFFEYCNDNNIDEAYNLLSTNCKEKLYPTKKVFKELYYENVFNTKKSFYMQSWIKTANIYTYKVTIMEDSLSTGKKSENVIDDYYTIVEEEGEQRINIGKYIATKNINSKNEKNGLEITVNYVDIYLENEIYNITIKNNSEYKFSIMDLKNIYSIHLTDEYNSKYAAYMYELEKDNEVIYPGNSIEMNIKFNKQRSNFTSRNAKQIVFENVSYKENEEEKNIKMKINLE